MSDRPDIGSTVRTDGGRLGIVESYIAPDATMHAHECPDCTCNRPAPFQGYAVVRWLDAERVDGSFIRFIPQKDVDAGYLVPENRQVRSYEWPSTLLVVVP